MQEFSKVPSSRVFDAPSDAVTYDPVTGRPSWHTDQSFRSPAPIAERKALDDTRFSVHDHVCLLGFYRVFFSHPTAQHPRSSRL